MNQERNEKLWECWRKVNPRVKNGDFNTLIQPVETQECFKVISQIENGESLGINGISVEVYKTH